MTQERHWTPPAPRWPWRDFLTETEAAEFAAIEAEMATLKARSAALSARRYPIQNRAIQRAKYAAAGEGTQP